MSDARPTMFETWKAIAHAVGRSTRWCRYMVIRAQDPLPVFKVGGIVRLLTADLDAWLEQQRETAMQTARRRPVLAATAPEEHW